MRIEGVKLTPMSGPWHHVESKIIRARVGRYNLVEISGHALEQMAIRMVREDQVLDTLREPDEEIPEAQPGRRKYRKSISAHRFADVVFTERSDHIVVITVISVQKEKPQPIIRRRRHP